MRLSEGLIAKFQKRHLEVFGEHIPPETAEAELLNLAELVLIMQPLRIIDIENGKDDE
jgi:hypothetical protein